MTYRLYTENKNTQQVTELVSGYHDGFTIYFAMGYWKGKAESSLVIEIITAVDYPSFLIDKLARDICLLNKQESVLVIFLPYSGYEVTANGKAAS